MSKEIELKLSIEQSDIPALLRHPSLNFAKPVVRQLRNTYYDTPHLQLRALGVALRFRQIGDLWLLTLKTGGPAAGGFSERGEWEYAAQPGVFDFAHIDDPALRRFLEVHVSQLMPVFTTDFTRHTWQLEHLGSTIEVALDQGQISSADQHSPLCEVELELLSNENAHALFSLAQSLSTSARLHPEIASKAERGYRLFRQEKTCPQHAAPSPLHQKMDVYSAFSRLAWSCLNQLQNNEAGALQQDDPEFTHQIRVAIRRLRSVIRLFAPQLPAVFSERYAPAWRNIGLALSSAREWEVLRYDTLPTLTSKAFTQDSAPDMLQTKLEHALNEAKLQGRAALKHAGYSYLLIEFSAALYALQHPAKTTKDPIHTPFNLNELIHKQLKCAWKKTKRRAKATHSSHPDTLNASELHRWRISLKHLRYSLEFASPLLPEPETKHHLKKLNKLLDTLGELHDLDRAETLLLAHTNAEEFNFLSQSAHRRRQHHRRLLPHHWNSARTAKKPWKTKVKQNG